MSQLDRKSKKILKSRDQLASLHFFAPAQQQPAAGRRHDEPPSMVTSPRQECREPPAQPHQAPSGAARKSGARAVRGPGRRAARGGDF